MSSTYAHYQGPSSLPSDYAILSRLRADTSTSASFPAEYYYRPHNPTIGSYPHIDPHSEAPWHLTHPPTEATPLLNNPPVPRIEENIDVNTSTNTSSNIAMFWEELAILTKYALPVFGYAPLNHSS